MKNILKPTLYSIIPAFILGGGFSFLIGMLGGVDNLKNVSPVWKFVGMALFMGILIFKNKGHLIFARFLRYLAYECWLSPLCVIIYSLLSVMQVHEKLGTAGAAGASVGGMVLTLLFAIGGGLLGLVLYLIGNSMYKNRVVL